MHCCMEFLKSERKFQLLQLKNRFGNLVGEREIIQYQEMMKICKSCQVYNLNFGENPELRDHQHSYCYKLVQGLQARVRPVPM